MRKRLIRIEDNIIEMESDGKGDSTLVFELGLGESIDDYRTILDSIAMESKYFIYNRPGYGNSTINRNVQWGVEEIVDNLYKILKNQRIKENIILVAHSFGGLCAQRFLMKYPQMVKGMILIDASPSDYAELQRFKEGMKNINEKYNTDNIIKMFKGNSLKTQEKLKEEGTEDVSPDKFYAMMCETKGLIGSQWDIDTNIKGIDIPIRVFIRDASVEIDKLIRNGIPKEEAEEFEGKVQESIRKQMNLSENTKVIECKGSDHGIHKNMPEKVILEIKDLIKSI